MSENVLLSTTGGAFGMVLAFWGTRFLARFVGSGPAAFLGSEGGPANLSLSVDLHPDVRVVAFTTALCVLAGIMFGMAPAFHWSAASRGSRLAVRGPGADSLGGRFGLRRLLIEIALLRPWKPVRVLVNGRSSGSGYSSQLYILREYHLALCTDPPPDRLAAPRLVDLQANLF